MACAAQAARGAAHPACLAKRVCRSSTDRADGLRSRACPRSRRTRSSTGCCAGAAWTRPRSACSPTRPPRCGWTRQTGRATRAGCLPPGSSPRQASGAAWPAGLRPVCGIPALLTGKLAGHVNNHCSGLQHGQQECARPEQAHVVRQVLCDVHIKDAGLQQSRGAGQVTQQICHDAGTCASCAWRTLLYAARTCAWRQACAASALSAAAWCAGRQRTPRSRPARLCSAWSLPVRPCL